MSSVLGCLRLVAHVFWEAHALDELTAMYGSVIALQTCADTTVSDNQHKQAGKLDLEYRSCAHHIQR